MKIIGICGFAGSGKGTAADILVRKYKFKKISFADSLKDATAMIFGWNRGLLEGDTDESRKFRETKDDFWSDRLDFDLTPRVALQKLGTEAVRNSFHNDVWVFAVEKKILDMINNPVKRQGYEGIVIPDVRFPNEVNLIRNYNGYVVRIKRGEEPEWYEDAHKWNLESSKSKQNFHSLKNYSDIHYSEWAWIGTQFDYVLLNDGNFGDLYDQIKLSLTRLQ